MTLSLVSAPVLGFDLTRHPNGHELSRLLVRAIAADSVVLAAVAARTCRAAEDELVAVRADLFAEDDGRLDLAGDPAPGGSGLAGLAASLLRTLVLRWSDVHALLVDDVLAWTVGDPRAVALRTLFADALSALWTRPSDHPAATQLAQAYRSRFGHGPDLALRAEPDPVAARLDAVRAFGTVELRQLRRHVLAHRPGTSEWAAAMHEASWAVVTTDRVRQAAVNQLLTVDAWFAAGFTAGDGAEGLWNAISGEIQALTVADVLSDDPRRILLAGTGGLLGPH